MFFGVRFGMNSGIASEGRPFNDKRGECYHLVGAAVSIDCEIFNMPPGPKSVKTKTRKMPNFMGERYNVVARFSLKMQSISAKV